MKKMNRCIFISATLPCLTLLASQAAALLNGQDANIVVGQPNMTSNEANQGGATTADTLRYPYNAVRNGNRLFIADAGNNRVLIYNTWPTANNAAADVVVGQPNLTSNASNNGGRGMNTLCWPSHVYSTGARLFVSDAANNRVLIFNAIPTTNGASANVVVGQPNSCTGNANNDPDCPPYGISARTLWSPRQVYSDGTRLFIADGLNNRVLIFNTIPTTNYTYADVVVGQANANTNAAGTSANTLWYATGVTTSGGKLLISDTNNWRVLIYNTIPAATGAAASYVIGNASLTARTMNYPNGNATPTSQGYRYLYYLHSNGAGLYVSDMKNGRVLIYNAVPTANAAAADRVIGQPDFYTAVTLTPTASRLSSPLSAFHTGTQLLAADEYNHRVLVYTEPTATVTPTVTPTGTITPTATRTATVLPTQTATARAPEISGDVIAYPAPARGESVWFYYRTAGPARVTLEIYNAAGERVMVLAEEVAKGGNHRLCWDIRQTAPGVYVYRLKTASAAGEHAGEWRKLAIVK